MYILKFHHISSEKKKSSSEQIDTFFVLRKFFAYLFILYALPLSSLVSIISYQDEIITVYARLYVSKSRNSGPPSSNRPFNENFIQGHFLKKIIDINMYVHMYIFSPHPCKSFKKVGVFL